MSKRGLGFTPDVDGLMAMSTSAVPLTPLHSMSILPAVSPALRQKILLKRSLSLIRQRKVI